MTSAREPLDYVCEGEKIIVWLGFDGHLTDDDAQAAADEISKNFLILRQIYENMKKK